MTCMQKTHHPIGKLLLSANLISESDLIRCLQIQKETGEKFRDIVVKEGLITEEEIVQLLAEQMGFPYIDLRRAEVKEEALKIINEDTAKRNIIFPVSVKGNILTIATSDPLNMSVMDDLYLITGYEMNVVVATSNDIEWAINRYYLPQGQKQNAQDEIQNPEETKILELDEVEDQNAPAITLTQSIISKAVARKASDIHIEQHEKEMIVRYRIDGVLHDIMVIPESLRPSVVSRLKIMANIAITEKRKPQDGGFHIKIDQHLLDVRMSTLPTLFGEKIVLRLLYKENIFKLEQLNFSPENLQIVKKAIKFPYGIMLVTGPTGSGKTTTLYSVLSELNTLEKNIVTVEDPVEYVLSRINQIQINPRAGLTFASGLRSILRQDPDIVMVGEIRDEETAKIAVQAALTGHLVLSTLHTNTALGSLYRLLNMGVEAYLLAASLKAMVAQRLVRRICPECKKEVEIQKEVLERIGIMKSPYAPKKFYWGSGCFHCQNTGYQGRVAIQEVILVDDELSELISREAPEQDMLNALEKKNFDSLFDDGVKKIAQGLTTVEEFLRVVYY